MTSQVSDVSTGRRVAVLTSAALCNVLTTFQFAAFGSYYVILTQHFDVSMLTVGWIGSLQIGLTFMSGFLVAPWIRHVGGRPVIQLSGLVLFTGYLLSALTTTSVFTLFFTYGIICGIGTSMLYLAAMVENQTTFSQNVVFAHTVGSFGFSGGTVLAGITVPYLLDLLGWRGLMAVQAAVMLHAIPLSFCFVQRRSSPVFVLSDENTSANFARVKNPLKAVGKTCVRLTARSLDFTIFKNRLFLTFCLARIGAFSAFYCIIAHTPSRAVHDGLTLQQGAQLVSIMSLATLTSRPLLAALTFRWHPNEVIIAALCAPLATLVTAAVAFVSDHYVLLATLYALNGLALGSAIAMMSPMVTRLFGQKHLARNQATAMLVDGCSIILAPLVVGALVDLGEDYFIAFLVISGKLAVCSVAMALVYIMQASSAKDAATI